MKSLCKPETTEVNHKIYCELKDSHKKFYKE